MKYKIQLDKKRPEMKTLDDRLNLRLSRQTKERLKSMAQEKRITISELIRRVISN